MWDKYKKKEKKSFGLKISLPKTKVVLVVEHPHNAICNIGSVQLENVTSFQYLGRIVTNDGDETKAVNKFISEGWHTYTKVKSTYILPCVMYASETITWNKVLMKKFEVFQNNTMLMLICEENLTEYPSKI